MSPRRRPPRHQPAADRPVLRAAPGRVEAGADGADYRVQPVPAARARKTYRCPGCDHEIAPATAHVVVWPAGPGDDHDPGGWHGGPEDRRHWHTGCWGHRGTRGPTRRWS